LRELPTSINELKAFQWLKLCDCSMLKELPMFSGELIPLQ